MKMTIEEKCTSPATLQPEVMYLDDFVKIEYDSNAKYINVEWLTHPDSESFRNGFYKAVELTLELGVENWLSDSRLIHYLEFADQNWMIEQVIPLLPSSSLKKFARIVSVESIALMDCSRIYSSLENLTSKTLDTRLEIFTTTESALEWLFPEAEPHKLL